MVSAPHCSSLMEVAMAEKIRLNDEQWDTLHALRDAANRRCPTDSIKVSDRLMSNGLVAADQQGRKFLTDQGLSRLNQGR
jgi:Spy/CpxP family protein refolding chaperone